MATHLVCKFKVPFMVLFIFYIGADSRSPRHRISQRKCHEYAEYPNEPQPDSDLSLSMETGRVACRNITQQHSDLFDRHESSYLPGVMKFPHMALIGYDDSSAAKGIHWVCGGSLISENFILTSARCLQQPVKYVLLGELDLDKIDDIASPVIFGTSEQIKHPNYSDHHFYNDIALIKLNQTVKFNRYINPVCLHQSHEIKAKEFVATGWGEDADGVRFSYLQEFDLGAIPFENCSQTYSNLNYDGLPNGINDDVQFCAGSYTDAVDMCAGDGGGPLQIYHSSFKCMFDLIGITSFGFPKCGDGPGVYTRVSHYLDWIENIVWLSRPNHIWN